MRLHDRIVLLPLASVSLPPLHFPFLGDSVCISVFGIQTSRYQIYSPVKSDGNVRGYGRVWWSRRRLSSCLSIGFVRFGVETKLTSNFRILTRKGCARPRPLTARDRGKSGDLTPSRYYVSLSTYRSAGP